MCEGWAPLLQIVSLGEHTTQAGFSVVQRAWAVQLLALCLEELERSGAAAERAVPGSHNERRMAWRLAGAWAHSNALDDEKCWCGVQSPPHEVLNSADRRLASFWI